ncbi:MAG: hypothetical protein COS14_09275 [Bacteroidetes bacterium CG02_land_8_20_14_3_00_31_25]|nr:DUF2007 domain-containing protein [Bacteroidota bacterium]PIV58507.1 MAG: hypothetical protein COS14_09275 [Bacteroidetes bacterium CG02_land_8_20_14_3_00_31_25]PIY02160.1 MAG: hypothetical protein COZ21_15625 [Bacteroidetes bacterium CG_4_10_14_3_um_filter_31_20]
MEDNWVLVFNTTDEVACERAKVVLKKEKIKSVVMNKKDSNFLIGEYQLYVNVDNLGNAREILKAFNIE